MDLILVLLHLRLGVVQDALGLLEDKMKMRKEIQNVLKLYQNLRCPGIEPGSTAWKAAMLTTIPTSLGE